MLQLINIRWEHIIDGLQINVYPANMVYSAMGAFQHKMITDYNVQ